MKRLLILSIILSGCTKLYYISNKTSNNQPVSLMFYKGSAINLENLRSLSVDMLSQFISILVIQSLEECFAIWWKRVLTKLFVKCEINPLQVPSTTKYKVPTCEPPGESGNSLISPYRLNTPDLKHTESYCWTKPI